LYCFVDDSGENEEEQSCGTTATVMLVRHDKIVVANVGDSRAVLSRAGQAIDLSTEHRYSVAPDPAQKLRTSCMPASAGCLSLVVHRKFEGMHLVRCITEACLNSRSFHSNKLLSVGVPVVTMTVCALLSSCCACLQSA